MAEKKTVTTYESVMRDLKARRFYPIYLLMGEESYFIDKISDYISNNVLQPEELFSIRTFCLVLMSPPRRLWIWRKAILLCRQNIG